MTDFSKVQDCLPNKPWLDHLRDHPDKCAELAATWLGNATSMNVRIYENIYARKWSLEEAHELIVNDRRLDIEVPDRFHFQTTTLVAWCDLFAANLNPEPLREYFDVLLAWKYPGAAHGVPLPLSKLDEKLSSAVRVTQRLGIILQYRDGSGPQSWITGPFGLMYSSDCCYIRRSGFDLQVDLSRAHIPRYCFELLVKANGNEVPLNQMRESYPGIWEARNSVIQNLRDILQPLRISIQKRCLVEMSSENV